MRNHYSRQHTNPDQEYDDPRSYQHLQTMTNVDHGSQIWESFIPESNSQITEKIEDRISRNNGFKSARGLRPAQATKAFQNDQSINTGHNSFFEKPRATMPDTRTMPVNVPMSISEKTKSGQLDNTNEAIIRDKLNVIKNKTKIFGKKYSHNFTNRSEIEFSGGHDSKPSGDSNIRSSMLAFGSHTNQNSIVNFEKIVGSGFRGGSFTSRDTEV